MEDDIDIEEHDVLNNPVIKNMFPDISVIKKEIERYETGLVENINTLPTNLYTREESSINSFRKVINTETLHGDDNVYTRELSTATFQTVINIETLDEDHEEIKPDLSRYEYNYDVQIVDVTDSEDTTPVDCTKNDLPLYSNRIILGSKPSKYFEEFFEEQKTYEVNLVLGDIKSYLRTSRNFCKECLILFPTKNHLDVHVRTLHSVEKSIVKRMNMKKKVWSRFNINCSKCTAKFTHLFYFNKHFDAMHRPKIQSKKVHDMITKAKNSLKNPKSLMSPNSAKCFHCNKIFSTQQCLIEHLYTILQKEVFQCKLCKKDFISKEQLNRHMLNHKKCLIVLNKYTKQQESNVELKNCVSKSSMKTQVGTDKNVAASSEELTKKSVELKNSVSKSSIKTQVQTDKNVAASWEVLTKKSVELLKNRVSLSSLKTLVQTDKNVAASSEELTKKSVELKNSVSKSSIKTQVQTDKNVAASWEVLTKKSVELLKNRVSLSSLKTLVQTDKNVAASSEILTKKSELMLEHCFRCYVCSFYFLQDRCLSLHLLTKHGLSKQPNEIKKCHFEPVCKYCLGRYSPLSSYNTHLMQVHNKYVNLKVNKTSNDRVEPFAKKTFRNLNFKVHKTSTDQNSEGVEPFAKKTFRNLNLKVHKTSTDQNTEGVEPFAKKTFRNLHLKVHKTSTDQNSEGVEPFAKKTFRNLNLKVHKTSTDQNSERVEPFAKKTYRNPKLDIFVLKSILFKCVNCDIHFLSAKIAKNHKYHMEMLINWKCAICKRIFKKKDEVLHKKQHEFSHEFTVHEVSQNLEFRVLYKCLKCAVHFMESTFLKHFSECNSEASNCVYCKMCKISINVPIHKTHEGSHISERLTAADFTIIESEILISNEDGQPCGQETSRINKTDLNLIYKNLINETSNEDGQPCGKETFLINKTGNLIHKNLINENGKNILEPISTDLFEESCKSDTFRTVNFRQTGDLQTSADINQDDSRTQNYKNLGNKKRLDILKKKMNKNIFYLLVCGTCKSVMRKKTKKHTQQQCVLIPKVFCKTCGFTLSVQNYARHNEMHSKIKNLTLQDFKFFDYNSGRQICPPMPEFPKCDDCKIHFMNKQTFINHICVTTDFQVCSLCKINLTEDAFQLHMLFHNYSKNKNENPILPKAIKKFKTHLPEGAHFRKILYRCKNCFITVNTYDEVVEHCQRHYYTGENETQTVTCQECNLIFSEKSYADHLVLNLHNSKEDIKVVNYDTFYFTSENQVWTNHVFGSLTLTERVAIIQKSIYKHECRIKLQVTQEGPSNLTVYRCEDCLCFIDESNLFKHAENSCFKLRKHPCSVCGLPFNSSDARMKHEKAHKKPRVTVKAYRIVSFNKSCDDKELNKLLFRRSQYFVLYQCRNCAVVVDKFQTNSHGCELESRKTCSECELLVHNDDYDSHLLRHMELPDFVSTKIKIVLFGENTQDFDSASRNNTSSFKGTVWDYTLYSCSECQICKTHENYLLTHTCQFGASRSKCSKCKLYFPTTTIKAHLKLHETDPEFVRSNIRIIMKSSLTRLIDNPGPGLESRTRPSPCQAGTSRQFENKVFNEVFNTSQEDFGNSMDIDEIFTKLYRCTCGLHFLDQLSILAHMKSCNPKIRVAKQTCSKCKFAFTPNILFSHLLKHHGNKKHVYKFSIVDMAQYNIIYKCSKCNLHFEKNRNVDEHLKVCMGKAEGSECPACNLIFEILSLPLHKCFNENNGKKIEVINLDYENVKYFEKFNYRDCTYY